MAAPTLPWAKSTTGAETKLPIKTHTTTTHHSTATPRPLTVLALHALADHPQELARLNHLAGLDEHLAVSLLRRVMANGRLDYRLACLFRDAGHDAIRDAIASLDLLEAMPTHNTVIPQRR
jgi:hypothetical protein